MKKLALSIAVSSIALAAASAQADEAIYSNDGLSLTVGADVEWVLDTGAEEDSDMGFSLDDADLDVKISSTADNGVTYFGYFEVEGQSDLDTLKLDDNYVGASYDAVTVKFGETTTAGDEFGIGMDEWYGVSGAIAEDSGSEVVNVEYSADEFTVVAAYDVDVEDDGYIADVYGEFYMGDITVAGLIQTADDNAGSESTSFGASVSYSMDALTVAGEFTTETESEVSGLEVAASYDVDEALTVAAGFGMLMHDDYDDNPMGYYANASYGLTDNASVFAEVAGYSDYYDDGVELSEVGFATGLSLSF